MRKLISAAVVLLAACNRETGDSIEGTGTLEVVEVNVSATVPARIVKVQVVEGQAVHEGDPVYSLYSPELYSAQREYLLARKRVNSLPADASPDTKSDASAVYNATLGARAKGPLGLLAADEAEDPNPPPLNPRTPPGPAPEGMVWVPGGEFYMGDKVTEDRPDHQIFPDAHPVHKVYVDGFYVGVVDEFDGAFQKLRLSGGRHRVEIRAEGFETIEFSVLVTPERTVTFAGKMKKVQ